MIHAERQADGHHNLIGIIMTLANAPKTAK